MRKKIILASLAAALLLMHTGCDDNKEEFLSDFSTILYFRNSGEVPLTIYKTGDNADYTLIVNKSGSELGATTEVSVAVMDAAALALYNAEQFTYYKALPANCYEMVGDAKLTFSSSELSKQYPVVFKTDAIYALPELPGKETYVLPIQLVNSKDSINSKKNIIFVQPNVSAPTVFFERNGYVQNYLSDEGAAEIRLTLPVSIPLASKWSFDCKIESDKSLLDAFNLENGTDYALLPAQQLATGVAFTPNGSMTENFNITVKRENLNYGNYVLPLRLVSSSKPEFLVDGKRNTCLYGVSYAPAESKLKNVALKESMLSCYPTIIPEGSLADLLDGNPETYFHSQYGGGAPALPHYLQIQLSAATTAFSFEYETRHNNNNGAPQAITLYGSMDGVEYGKIATITEGLVTAARATYKSPVFAAKPFKYLRVSVERTASGSFAMAALRLKAL